MDISPSSPYYKAAAWAVENSIMAGTSSTTLSLDLSLIREQAAVFFMSFSNRLGLSYSYTSGPAASSFSDYKEVSAWATTGMDFCTRRGLIAGVGDNSLAPNTTLTRDQIGVILYACTQKASRTR